MDISKIPLFSGEVTITGRIGKSLVTYTGVVDEMVIEVDNGLDETEDFLFHKWEPKTYYNQYTLRLKMKEVDDKQITVKTEPLRQVVAHTAEIPRLEGMSIDQHRADAGASKDAGYLVDLVKNTVKFTWKEEV